jgi:ABC-type antimicrobial peptide transport system permease subunit
VVLKEESHLPLIYDRLVKNFPKPQAETLTWKDVQRPLMALIALNKSANRLLMGIILFISALGIANSILMSILERTREFGVMLAMGTSKKEVIKMVITETVLLSLVGVFLGNILGIAVTEYFHSNGFDLKWLTSQPIMVQGTIVQTVIVFLSFVVSFLPVRHVANLNVVKALRAN